MTDAERIAELRRALEPFATYYHRIDTPQFRSDAAIVIEVPGDLALTVGAFRQAALAIRPRTSSEFVSVLPKQTD